MVCKIPLKRNSRSEDFRNISDCGNTVKKSKLPTKMIILSMYYPYLQISNIQTFPKRSYYHKITKQPGF